MLKPPQPADEPARLASLQALGLLDTPPEERFDRLTRLASRLFDVPIALVSLVDTNRQWFKSCLGVDVRETPRDISFCGHAILADQVFMIPDASADPRFADNPLVTDSPHIRFYAGCPLKAPDGKRLGTLCIIDTAPRRFAGEDMLLLRDLAAMVESEMVAMRMAAMDELTGISNRRGFLQLARHALALCLRQNLAASLIFIDLDGFKAINDNYGHAEGDRALRAFAETLQQVYRESDCYGRLGGDEFVVLLARASATEAASSIRRFNEALGRLNATLPYRLACSQGIVQFDPERHTSIEVLLAEGDALMYERKQERHSNRKR